MGVGMDRPILEKTRCDGMKLVAVVGFQLVLLRDVKILFLLKMNRFMCIIKSERNLFE